MLSGKIKETRWLLTNKKHMEHIQVEKQLSRQLSIIFNFFILPKTTLLKQAYGEIRVVSYKLYRV